MFRATFLMALMLGAAPVLAQTSVTATGRIYYGPAPGFDQIDIQLINRARQRIDFALYSISNAGVIEALAQAAKRGVKIRFYIEPSQRGMFDSKLPPAFAMLLRHPNVQAKFKAAEHDLMHFKTYHVDGKVLRSGTTNFTTSSLRRQDNDIVIYESPQAAATFMSVFEKMWARADNAVFRP